MRQLASDVPSNAGPITMLRAPFTIDGERPAHPQGAPTLGEHTEPVLTGLGLSGDDISDLRRQGIVDRKSTRLNSSHRT